VQLHHASDVLYVAILGLAKASAACSILSLTVLNRGSLQHASIKHKIVFSLTVVAIAIWTLGSVIVLSVQCSPISTARMSGGTCDGRVRDSEANDREIWVLRRIAEDNLDRDLYLGLHDGYRHLSICSDHHLVDQSSQATEVDVVDTVLHQTLVRSIHER
jgi:hypothetical protein